MASTLKKLHSYIANPNPSTISNPNFKSKAMLQFNIGQEYQCNQHTEGTIECKIIESQHQASIRLIEVPLRDLKSPQSQELYRLISESLSSNLDPYLCKEFLIPRVFNQAVNQTARLKKFEGFLRIIFDIEILTVAAHDEMKEMERLSGLKEATMCPVCWDEMERSSMFVCCCGHVFHESCLGKWLRKKNSCPLCRGVVLPRLMHLSLGDDHQLLLYLWSPKKFVP